ncbi:spatacsin isoform X2 [Rhynchophorus ferrugineus]|uniref:spatacsin isoform X2 n=1 Tax=Rhynchophorus ferrugineus TaxID=354439 RepID=UPI003FCE6FC7
MYNIRYGKYININKGNEPNHNRVTENKEKNVKTTQKEQINPTPPQGISKENLSIWIGWTRRTDKEIIREAASKGHILLAETFLAQKNNTLQEEAYDVIKNEVLTWIEELLERKLIFRVTTILTNAKLDTIEELQNIFYKTQKRHLRGYIYNYLKEQDKISLIYENLQNFLEIIIDNKLLTHQNNLMEESIEGLDKQTDMWKNDVSAKLFINIHDNNLEPFLKPEHIWKQLLCQNEIDVIIYWIQLAFAPKPLMSLDLPKNLLSILKNSAIDQNMLDIILSTNLPPESLENILNELGRYGVFINETDNKFLSIVSRVNSSDNIGNIYNILNKTSSNITISRFVTMLTEYAIENDLLPLFSSCLDNLKDPDISINFESRHVELMASFQNLTREFNEELLCNNIYTVAKYLSNGDIEKYFCDNPYILLSLILFTPDIFIEDVFEKRSLSLYDIDVYNCIIPLFDSSSLLGKLYSRRTKPIVCTINYFDLLDKHHGIDTRKIYSFRFENKPLPSFASPDDLKNVAYSKKLNYTFYLKSGRPSIASKRFYLDQLKVNSAINTQQTEDAKKKVFKIGVTKFYDVHIAMACISFMEMIGVDSTELRIAVQAANIIGHNNSSVEIVPLLLNMEKNAYELQTLLDEAVTKTMDFTKMVKSAEEFIKACKRYEIVVQFSVLRQLPLPDLFLSNLAQNNMWFQFLLYSEMKNYPMEQVKPLCANFKNPSLLEHIVHSVVHDIDVKESSDLVKRRNSKSYMLFKRGMKRMFSREKLPENDFDRSGRENVDSNFTSFDLDQLEIDISNTKATLLQTLIRCHNSADPPKAFLQASYFYRSPLLSILATIYEPDSIITSWLTWLCVSTNLHEACNNMESLRTNAQSVSDLLNTCVMNKFPKSLLESFVIFLPDNPLTSFLDFLNRIIDKDICLDNLRAKLKQFKTQNASRRVSVFSQVDFEMNYLKNRLWIESTALKITNSFVIYNTTSYLEELDFVNILSRVNLRDYFTCEVPDFTSLLQILETVFRTEVNLNVANYLDVGKRQEEIERCVENLMKFEHFEHALSIAKLCGMDTNFIVLKKWQKAYENRRVPIEDFLKSCCTEFQEENVLPEYAISFFKERGTINDREKYFLLKASHRWAVDNNLTNKYELERKKIIAFLNIPNNNLPVDELVDGDTSNDNISYREMLERLQKVHSVEECLTEDHTQKLNEIMVTFLDQGRFWLALSLGKMFGCDNVDVDMLKLCHELAEEIISPHQLTDKKPVLSKFMDMPRKSFRRSFTYRTVSVSSENKSYEDLEWEDCNRQSKDSLTLIHGLVSKLTHGVDLGYSIFMKYRISRNIDTPYTTLISCMDHVNNLKQAIQDDCSNKLYVVHDFLKVFDWTKNQIIDFVCEQFSQSVSNYTKSSVISFTMWDIRLDTQFELILKLFKNDSYNLGYKFYSEAIKIHQQLAIADENFKISDMALVVELLIASHAFFTSDCSMEGISLILRKCRSVVLHLLAVRSWKLIVRLFTGVQRYTELNFVFHILKENHQFEFLLNKGTNKDKQLKQACVEFLKKNCPMDKELYRIVAIHFSMYSDIAEDYEIEGKDHLKTLKTLSRREGNDDIYFITKNPNVRELLHKAMDCYVLAAEYHVEGQKMTRAMSVLKQSELIAIQKSLLAHINQNEKAPLLFDLNRLQIITLMSTYLNFHQAMIVMEAYNFTPDWASILFEQVIQKNNLNYLESFMDVVGIDEQLVMEIGRKFNLNKINSGSGYKNMTHLICCLRSVNVKFRLAKELGFNQLIEKLALSEETSYLKDVVWKKGKKG